MIESSELGELREKVKSLDSELYSIRSVAKRAIGDYDDLYGKYRDAKKTNDELNKKFLEQELKFEQMVQVLQGAANDCAAMESKVQLGEYLRNEAEKIASKMFEENRKIKRQSQRLIEALGDSTVAVEIDIETDTGDLPSSAQVQSRNEIIENLEKTIETMQSKLNNAVIEKQKALNIAEEYRVKYEDERQKLSETKTDIGMYEAMKENFARVSKIATDRIDALEKEIEFERSLTSQAINKASTWHTKHKALKRQSLAVLHSPNQEESLNRALDQIQTLTTELDTQKTEYEEKLATMSIEKQNEMIEDLKKQINNLQEENETVSKQNEALFKQLETANYNNRVLREQCDQAKKGPPPPPPPPPPPVKMLNPIRWILGKNTKSDEASSKGPKKPEGAENFDKALAELMERIKNKSSAQPSVAIQKLMDEDTHQTSKQLNDFIGALKKTTPKVHSPIEKELPPEPEFMQIRRKMSGSKDEIAKGAAVTSKAVHSNARKGSASDAKINEEDEVQLRR